MVFYMANIICINKANTVPNYITVSDPYNQSLDVGKIGYNEVFTAHFGSGDGVYNYVTFKNSRGDLTYGMIPTPPSPPDWWESIWTYAYSPAFRTNQYNYNGKWLDGYTVKRKASIYTAGGSYWGAVSAGSYVFCESYPSAGQSNPGLLQIHGFYNMTNYTYYPVTGDGANYGFVDIGYAYGSGKSTLSVIGNW